MVNDTDEFLEEFVKKDGMKIVYDVVEKHRVVVEVESLASSSKKNTTRRHEDGGVVVEKKLKVDELSIKILAIYLQQ